MYYLIQHDASIIQLAKVMLFFGFTKTVEKFFVKNNVFFYFLKEYSDFLERNGTNRKMPREEFRTNFIVVLFVEGYQNSITIVLQWYYNGITLLVRGSRKVEDEILAKKRSGGIQKTSRDFRPCL